MKNVAKHISALIFALSSFFTIAMANEASLKDATLKELKEWDPNASCTGENLAFKCNGKQMKLPFELSKHIAFQNYHLDVKASQNSIETNAKSSVACNDSLCDAKVERIFPKVITINEKKHKNGTLIRVQEEITMKADDGSTLFIQADYGVDFNDDKFKQTSLVDFVVQTGSSQSGLLLVEMGKILQAKDISINIKKIKILLSSPTLNKIVYDKAAYEKRDSSYNPKKYESDIQLGIGFVRSLMYSDNTFRALSKQATEAIDKILDNTTLLLLGKKNKIGIELRFKNDTYINLDQLNNNDDMLKFLNLLDIKPI